MSGTWAELTRNMSFISSFRQESYFTSYEAQLRAVQQQMHVTSAMWQAFMDSVTWAVNPPLTRRWPKVLDLPLGV